MMNLQQMMQKPTFDEQLVWLMSTQLDERKLLIQQDVHANLQAVLRPYYPQGNLFPYGSTESDLALKSSDLDFFYDASGNFSDDNKIQEKHQYQETSQSKLQEIFDGVYTVLRAYPSLFEKIEPISSANVPVITFQYRPTNTKCDISFKNGFGIFNTKLMKFCLTSDSRIKPLIIIIKCWAREQNLSGKGMITNYALIMLVFFYLQQQHVRLIPLMRDLKTGVPVYYKGYNVNFNSYFPSTTVNCNQRISNILQGFFEFYSRFDFGNKVICLFNGTASERARVQMEKNSGIIYPELNKFACLQDPIELNRNVISSWTEALVKHFQVYCKETAAKIQMSHESLILPKILQQY